MHKLAYRANIATINARGNNGDTDEEEPATIRDEYGISVGASGDDGHIATQGQNLGGPNDDQNESKYGREMDVLAPGANPQLQKTPSFSSNTSYQKFGATSAATPQVAGLAAWVLNQAAYPLAVEDVERLVEYTAADKSSILYEEFPGYDERSGWGLIDAGAALDLVYDSKVVRARVIGANMELVTEIGELSCDFSIGCPVELLWGDPDTSASPGKHFAKVWRYYAGFSLDVCQELGVSFQTFPDTTKEPFWVLNSLSAPYGPGEVVDTSGFDRLEIKPWEDSRFQDISWDTCSLSGILVGYKYEFTYFGSTLLDPTITIPHTFEEDFFFSFLVKADTSSLPDTILLENLILSDREMYKKDFQNLAIWPNPFDNQLAIRLPQSINYGDLLQVFDLQGRLLFQQELSSLENTDQLSISTTYWPSGAYFVRVISPVNLLFAKAIKF